MTPLDVCMTASLRAETLKLTLDSFAALVRAPEGGLRWHINLDPAGEGPAEEVLQVVAERGLDVVWNRPERANLNAALRWCYRQATGPVFFILEDDVEFIRPFDLAGAVEEFGRHERLAYLAVPRCPFPADDRAGIQNGPQQGPITWRAGGYKMCLGPGLLSAEFARGAAERMRDFPDPELQFHLRNPELTAWTNSWRFATYGTLQETWSVQDIGRPYRDARGYVWVDTPGGTVWRKNA